MVLVFVVTESLRDQEELASGNEAEHIAQSLDQNKILGVSQQSKNVTGHLSSEDMSLSHGWMNRHGYNLSWVVRAGRDTAAPLSHNSGGKSPTFDRNILPGYNLNYLVGVGRDTVTRWADKSQSFGHRIHPVYNPNYLVGACKDTVPHLSHNSGDKSLIFDQNTLPGYNPNHLVVDRNKPTRLNLCHSHSLIQDRDFETQI
jgi:hypothetical protein